MRWSSPHHVSTDEFKTLWQRYSDTGTPPFGLFVVPEEFLRIEYFEAFNLLFRVENTLRIFAYAILKAAVGDDFANFNIGEKTVARIAESCRNREARHGYLVAPAGSRSNPFSYLTMGELSELI